jgi:hypothetical protein
MNVSKSNTGASAGVGERILHEIKNDVIIKNKPILIFMNPPGSSIGVLSGFDKGNFSQH